jgi:TrbL/VirB6 plasmid conjugal transfer protein
VKDVKHPFFLSFFFLLLLIFQSSVVFAEETERKAKERDESAYELMSYADDGWWDVAAKTGSATATAVKNFFWMINIVLSQITMMVVYQLFSLDVVDMTKDAVHEITAGTAGTLTFNFGLFALSVASIGIVVRSYIQQNWQAFFKLLTLILLSLTLLFSIQSKKFNYIDLAHGLSTSLENAVMSVNPTLNDDDAFQFNSFDKNTAKNVSIGIENKVFDALIYKPYLLLQYGTTQEKKILAEDTNRISDYLKADPRIEEGVKQREEIAQKEYDQYDNKNIFAGNGWKQAGYILVMILSTVIQGVVFFFIALIRVMLQFAFIMMLLLAPIMIFISLFPSFEALVGRYLKGTTILILFKSVTMFFVLVATSFISLGYEMTNMSDDIYYRIFIQIMFCVAIVFMYSKRQFALSMLEGATPNLHQMGASTLNRKSISKAKRGMQGAVSQLRQPIRRFSAIKNTNTNDQDSSSSRHSGNVHPIRPNGKTSSSHSRSFKYPNQPKQDTAVAMEQSSSHSSFLPSQYRKPKKLKHQSFNKDEQNFLMKNKKTSPSNQITNPDKNEQLNARKQKIESMTSPKRTQSSARNPYQIKDKTFENQLEQTHGKLNRTPRLRSSSKD